MHGKTSTVHHDGAGVFRNLSQPFSAGRYHSLVVAQPLPADLELAAQTDDGTVMGVATPDVSDPRRAVPPRVRADERGPDAAAQLPGDVMFARSSRSFSGGRTSRSRKRPAAMDEIMEGRAQPAQIAGLLIALAMKGERPAEVVGLARTMRARATKLSSARTTTCSIPAAPAAIARTRSTSRRSPRSSWRRAASGSRSTAIDRSRAAAAAPTCSKRSASTLRPRRRSSSAASTKPASRSSSRRRSTRRCGMPRRRAATSACAPRSTFSGR